MSALYRALLINGRAAQQQEQRLSKLLDRKEDDLARQKKLTEALDLLEGVQQDGELSAEDKDEVMAAALAAGVELSEHDFAQSSAMILAGGGRTALHEEQGKSEKTWDEKLREELDQIGKKIERHQTMAQDSTGQTDLELNLAMNKLSQRLQDANGVITTIRDLERNLTPGS